MARTLHAIVALTAAFALVLQFGLSMQDLGVAGAAWRLLGFYTILTNAAVAVVSGTYAARPSAAIAGPVVRFVALVSITLVGIVFWVALRGTVDLAGWRRLTDAVFHSFTPAAYALAWLTAGHGGIGWRHLGWAVLPPIGYLAYAMARGALDGWYAYWFLDPATLTLAAMLRNIAILSAAFLAFGAVVILIDYWLARRAGRSIEVGP